MIRNSFYKERDDEKRVWIPQEPRGIPEEEPRRAEPEPVAPERSPEKSPEREKELEPVGV